MGFESFIFRVDLNQWFPKWVVEGTVRRRRDARRATGWYQDQLINNFFISEINLLCLFLSQIGELPSFWKFFLSFHA